MRTFHAFAFVAALAAASLSGCATVTDAMSAASGMGVISEQHNAFDDSTTVSVSAMPLWARGSWGNRVRLGALWTSRSPDLVALQMSYGSDVRSAGNAYASLTGMDINVDGDITHWRAGTSTNLDSSQYNTVSKTIYTSSRNAVVIPYSLLQRMVTAKDCRLRIHVDGTYEDSQFSIARIPGGQATALVSIRKFMAKVDELRGAKR